MSYSFKNDYAEGAHPQILKTLLENNLSQQNGYGEDEFSLQAKNLISQKLNISARQIFFVSGGTQANLTVIAAFLRPHEGIISAETSHIFNNEAFAIEATGHKIVTIKSIDGKIKPNQIEEVLNLHQNRPHQGKFKLVYISNATELGTVYTQQELVDLSEFCRKNDLYLFADGARFSQALASKNNNTSLEYWAELTDVFTIGGTKNGALLGEAIIINHPDFIEDFPFHIKQRGAMLAKGRILGLQFRELFRNDFFLKLATEANGKALKISTAFKNRQFSFLIETETNQIFPILKAAQIEKLSKNFEFYVWQKVDAKHSAIRLITSWATTEESIQRFITEISEL